MYTFITCEPIVMEAFYSRCEVKIYSTRLSQHPMRTPSRHCL